MPVDHVRCAGVGNCLIMIRYLPGMRYNTMMVGWLILPCGIRGTCLKRLPLFRYVCSSPGMRFCGRCPILQGASLTMAPVSCRLRVGFSRRWLLHNQGPLCMYFREGEWLLAADPLPGCILGGILFPLGFLWENDHLIP